MTEERKGKNSATANEDGTVEVEGEVVQCLRGIHFLVELENEHRINAHLSGKVRQNVTVTPGDRVLVELSPYDLTKGIIVWRLDDDGRR